MTDAPATLGQSRRPRALRRPPIAAPVARLARSEVAVPLAFAGLLLVWAVFLRTRGIGMSYWIDEGLSVGIGSHPLTHIPNVLLQDGSPPLYYMLLHVWMGIFGSGEVATHWLSMVFGLLCVPVALWAGWSLFGKRVGLFAVALAALCPFLTWYSTETRMYALLASLALLGTATFLHAFVFRRRRYVPLFALTVVLMLYTHNWAAFFALGCAAAGLWLLWRGPDRRGVAIDGAIVVAVAALAYAPWVPTLLSQIAHTGAPWTVAPTWRAALSIAKNLFSSVLLAALLLAGAAAGLRAALGRGRRPDERAPDAVQARAFTAALILLVSTILSAWMASKITPAWAPRYFATFVGPLVIVLAVALARARRVGVVAMVAVGVVWAIPHHPGPSSKSNARAVAAKISPALRAGDTVLSTWPEQVPVLHHYLPAGLRYVTPLGPVADPTVMDWRDGLSRFRRARPASALEPLLARIPVGGRVVLIRPRLAKKGWREPWNQLVRRRTDTWAAAVAADPRFRLLRQVPRRRYVGKIGSRLIAYVYVKRSQR